MSKADNALTTSITPTPTRRSVLSTGAAVLTAAAATYSAEAGATTAAISGAAFSAEYQAYVAARAAVAACGAEDIADADYDAHEKRMDLLLDRSWAAAKSVMERSPANWDEVAEAAHVVFTELWDARTWEKHSSCQELEVGLFEAIFAMKQFPSLQRYRSAV